MSTDQSRRRLAAVRSPGRARSHLFGRSLLVALLAALAAVVPARPAAATPIVPVRAVYLVPADRAANPAYTAAIDMALRDLQSWYAAELGGATFAYAPFSVEVLFTPHPASYYATNPHPFSGTQWDFWFNVADDARQLGIDTNDPTARWAVYIDADPAPGQNGGAASGAVAIISGQDLRGLVGQEPLPVDRWIGGLGHELGHTFGLPHPLDCVGTPVPAGCEGLRAFGPLDYAESDIAASIMQFGYLTYRATYLLPEERAFLRSTPYFGPVSNPPSAVPEPASLVLLGTGLIASVGLRRRVSGSRR